MSAINNNAVASIGNSTTLVAGDNVIITEEGDTITISALVGDIDGGFANSVYLPIQLIDGGGA